MRGLVFAVVALLLASGSMVWGSWQIETVDYGQYVSAPSLAVDSSGTPHMSYRGEGTYPSGSKPMYAFREEGGSWHIEAIPGMSYCNSNSAIAIDSLDRPHVVSSTTVEWYYGTLTDTGWTTQKVYQGGWNGSNCGLDMVTDSNDGLHVSFTAWTPADNTGTNRVGYAFKDDGSAFSLHHDLEPNGIIGTESFVALDLYGNPAIAYTKYDYSSALPYSLRLARWTGTNWAYTTVATGATPSGMAFDAAGNLHIAYRGNYPTFGSDSDLFYARYDKNSQSWSTTLVDDTWKSSGFYAGIGLDGSGNPQIAYSAYDGSKWALRYAKASDALGLSWDLETIEYGENAVWGTELVMDADFTPHIAYSGAVSGSDYVLKYATWGGSSPPVPELPPTLLAAGLPLIGLCLRRFRRR